MNKFIWKLLREHISVGQLIGFFIANLFGVIIVLLSIQFYKDIIPVFTQGDSFLKREYIVITKKISTLRTLAGGDNTFPAAEIEEIKSQPFVRSLGTFTPTRFNVSAGLSMPEANIQLSTAMFFESVPDEYIDINLDKWQFDEQTRTIPIIIPRNYLNLYNYGFAQSRNLPKISEGLIGLVNMDIYLRGNGHSETFKGNIAGFSNRLNTILVPESFMTWANEYFAPNMVQQPSRVIIEVTNPADPAIAQYIQQKGYEVEDGKADTGKTAYFLRLIIGVILVIGLIISILSFYILILSIFLLLQKNTTKLENLLLIGYSRSQVAFPYQALTVGLNVLILVVTLLILPPIRSLYIDAIRLLSPQIGAGGIWPAVLAGLVLTSVLAIINILLIKRKIKNIG